MMRVVLLMLAAVTVWGEGAPAAIVDRFVGRFALDRDDVLHFRPVPPHVSLRRTALKEVRLEVVSANELVNRETGEQYVFDFDGDLVKIGEASAQRTRVASPFDIIGRDVATGIAEYGRLDASLLSEERLRVRGVALLEAYNVPAAVALLKLNTERHAGSAAAHDALATAQLAAGDTAGARLSSQKVLEIVPAGQDVYRERAERRLRESAQ